MKRRHLKRFTDSSGRHHATPTVTGDPSLWLMNHSGQVASATWFDISVNGNHGTASVASILADFYFDGLANNPPVHYVDVALPTSASDPAKNWTLEMWVTHNTIDPPPAGLEGMASTRDGGLATGWTLRNQGVLIGDPIDLDTFGGLGNLGAPCIPANRDDAWHNYTLTWAPGSPATLNSYVDGVFYATFSAPATHQWATAVGTNLGFRVGAGAYNEWAGHIDTVRVYPRILSADEILRDYHAGKPAHP